MQLTLKIESKAVARKILWILEHFKKDGLSIKQIQDNKAEIDDQSEKNVNSYSDEYLNENWKELVMTNGALLVDDGDCLEQAHANWNKD